MELNKKPYCYNDEYKKIQKAFLEIEKDIQKDLAETKKKKTALNEEKYFMQLKFLGEIAKQMYLVNDYESACHIHIYILPRVEKFLDYLVKGYEKGNKRIIEFCERKDKHSSYKYGIQTRECGRLEYLYDVFYWEMMKISARYFIHWNILYLEREKVHKDYPSREEILRSAVYYTNVGLLNRFNLKMPKYLSKKYRENEEIIPREVVFSTMPSSGKSYLANTFNQMGAVLGAMLMDIGGILRVGNEQGNIFRQSRQTMNMLENPLIFDIYPELKTLKRSTGKVEVFGKSSEEEWGIRGVKNDPSTTVFKTRDSAINSVRCYIGGIYDDPSRGQEEANNITVHKSINAKFYGDFQDRFKSQDDMFILLQGTMFNEYDVFSTEMDNAKSKGYYHDNRFKNTMICDNGNVIVIQNDCEDEFGNSAYPMFISTKALMEKKKNLSEFEYACTWRQRPIPPEGLIFSSTLLTKYTYGEELVDENGESLLEDFSFAYLDPTRKSDSDFLSMPIFKRHKKTKKFYLVDCLFRRKSTKVSYDDIIKKILTQKIIKFVIEKNTSEDLDTVLNDKLRKLNINTCKIETIYSTVNKQQRIADFADIVKMNIVFPSNPQYNPKINELDNYMNWLCQYNVKESNKYDDAPDSACGFAKHFILDKKSKNRLKAFKNIPF